MAELRTCLSKVCRECCSVLEKCRECCCCCCCWCLPSKDQGRDFTQALTQSRSQMCYSCCYIISLGVFYINILSIAGTDPTNAFELQPVKVTFIWLICWRIFSTGLYQCWKSWSAEMGSAEARLVSLMRDRSCSYPGREELRGPVNSQLRVCRSTADSLKAIVVELPPVEEEYIDMGPLEVCMRDVLTVLCFGLCLVPALLIMFAIETCYLRIVAALIASMLQTLRDGISSGANQTVIENLFGYLFGLCILLCHCGAISLAYCCPQVLPNEKGRRDVVSSVIMWPWASNFGRKVLVVTPLFYAWTTVDGRRRLLHLHSDGPTRNLTGWPIIAKYTWIEHHDAEIETTTHEGMSVSFPHSGSHRETTTFKLKDYAGSCSEFTWLERIIAAHLYEVTGDARFATGRQVRDYAPTVSGVVGSASGDLETACPPTPGPVVVSARDAAPEEVTGDARFANGRQVMNLTSAPAVSGMVGSARGDSEEKPCPSTPGPVVVGARDAAPEEAEGGFKAGQILRRAPLPGVMFKTGPCGPRYHQLRLTGQTMVPDAS